MTPTRRFITLLVLAVLMTMAFLGGALTAAGGLASPPGAAGQANLTSAQWAAIQAGNSLLSSGFSAAIYMPLIVQK